MGQDETKLEGITLGNIDERFDLVRDRICEIPDELTCINEEKYTYLDFFDVKARYINKMLNIYAKIETNDTSDVLNKETNYEMYEDIIGDNYNSSYSNPDYAEEKLGIYGKVFSFISAELAELPGLVFDKKKAEITFLLETFLELYFMFKNGDSITVSSVEDVVRSYAVDYAEYHTIARIQDTFVSGGNLANDIIESAV